MSRSLAILLGLLAVTAGCGGTEVDDRAGVRGASLLIDRPAGRQFDGGLQGAPQPTSPAQELMQLIIIRSQIDKAGSSPDPVPGLVGSSPDPMPGICNDAGDCIPPRAK